MLHEFAMKMTNKIRRFTTIVLNHSNPNENLLVTYIYIFDIIQNKMQR